MSGWIYAGLAYGALLALVGVTVGRHLKRLHGHYRRTDRRDWP